ncbi:MAG: NUDIX domain-containing protein [Candidatus Woesearchaeota archaeon]
MVKSLDFERFSKFSLTSDAVVFTIMGDALKILLIKRGKPPFEGMYALPGGFLRDGETFEQGCTRELAEETNVSDIFLKKLNVYDAVDRDPRGRVITTAFLAIIDAERVRLEASTDAVGAGWFDVYSLPNLAFDHEQMIADALEELRYEIQISNIAVQLLGNKFTLSQLQAAYETILDTKLDKRNFRKRIKELDVLAPLKETVMEGAHRPAQLYRFKSKKYVLLKDKIHVLLK